MSQRPVTQLSLGISSHNNRFLFSDHYLNDILKRDTRWKTAIKSADAILPWLTDLYERENAQFADYSESQLEDNWFKPILAQLGHTFEGQARVPGLASGIKRPDFVFFPDEDARRQAVAQQKTNDYTQHALAVGEVKAWDVPLGKKQKGAPSFDNNNPSFQIDYYLRATNLTWGILSNGRQWRLVHKESSYKLDVYFEIDLAQAIADQNRAALTFFVLFFKQAALRPDANGHIFLADALEASAAYALRLENDLRDNAYKALEHLIQGFIEPAANKLSADDLPVIYTNSLYLLYRIIFLFYGEARGLLPIENEAYQKYSITQFARDIARDLDAGKQAPPMTNQSWARLQQLFTIIAGSQPDLNEFLGVPRYNGGLFNSDLHPFLEQHFVGDRYLHAAIDAIARREVGEKKAEKRRENVDYRTLGVRQLGSIYEGLLEYQPRRATEPMAAVKKTKGEEWLPAAKVKGRTKVLDRRDVGDVYLVTDKGERKATGSYYTPDYIVKYIVEQTLGPLVEQTRERVKAGGSGDVHGQTFAQEILKLDVLDPAMGSGHFLVEATDFLARAIATDNFVTVDDAQATDDDLVYWRRQVVETCIYGVDKNPMAVELAKLSLWLVTVAKDRPLSFLDHHLQHGDSLVGARLADLNALPGKSRNRVSGRNSVSEAQPPLLNETALVQDTFKAVGGMLTIETMLSDSIEDIHAKEVVLAQVRGNLDRWRTIADLWTSSFFGNAMTPEEYGDLLRYLQATDKVTGTLEVPVTWMLSADQRERFLQHPAVTDNDYFHWELAFPEVFFDRHGQSLGDDAGFDAIVGNPPYIRQEGMSTNKPYYASCFDRVYDGKADIYVYFYFLSIDLLHKYGRTSFIVTNKWLKAGYGEGIRRFLAQNSIVRQIVDFGHAPVFEDVDAFPVIMILSKVGRESARSERTAEICLFPRDELRKADLGRFVRANSHKVPNTRFDSSPWLLEPVEVEALLSKIRSNGIPLAEYVGESPIYGVKTGYNMAFLIDESTKDALICSDHSSAEIILPYLRGQDIGRWIPTWENLWMILTHRGVDIDKYPAVQQYLASHRTRLEQRAGSQPWWQLQGAPSNHAKFARPKLIYQEIQFHPAFCIDADGLYTNNKAFIIPTSDTYLLGVLNSPLMWWHNWRYLPHMKDEALNPKGDLMSKLPIALPTDEIQSQVESIVGKILDISRRKKHQSNEFVDWLGSEFGIEKLGMRLQSFQDLAEDEFINEIRQRRNRNSARLGPTDLSELKHNFQLYSTEIRRQQYMVAQFENKLSNLINAAYHLTSSEVEWLWRTAPPRMPIAEPTWS